MAVASGGGPQPGQGGWLSEAKGCYRSKPGLIYIEYGGAAPILVMGSSQSKASRVERRMRPNRHVCLNGPGSEVATPIFGSVKQSEREWNLVAETLERQEMSDPAGL